MHPSSLIAFAFGALVVVTFWSQTWGKPIENKLYRQSRQFLSTGSSDISDVIGTPFITQSIAKKPIYTGLSDATKSVPKGGSSQTGSAASGKGPTKAGGGQTDTKKGNGGNSGGNKKNGSSNNKNSGGNKDKNSSEEGSSGSSESQESAEPGYGYDGSESREEYDD